MFGLIFTGLLVSTLFMESNPLTGLVSVGGAFVLGVMFMVAGIKMNVIEKKSRNPRLRSVVVRSRWIVVFNLSFVLSAVLSSMLPQSNGDADVFPQVFFNIVGMKGSIGSVLLVMLLVVAKATAKTRGRASQTVLPANMMHTINNRNTNNHSTATGGGNATVAPSSEVLNTGGGHTEANHNIVSESTWSEASTYREPSRVRTESADGHHTKTSNTSADEDAKSKAEEEASKQAEAVWSEHYAAKSPPRAPKRSFLAAQTQLKELHKMIDPAS